MEPYGFGHDYQQERVVKLEEREDRKGLRWIAQLRRLPQVSEDEGIAFVRSGDERGIVWLIQRYGGYLYRIAYSRVKSHQRADDIVQEVLIKVWLRGNTYSPDRPFPHWLSRVATNAVIDEVRRTNRAITLNQHADISDWDCEWHGVRDPKPLADEAAAENEFRRRFREAVAFVEKGHPQHAKVLRMRWEQGLTIQEITETVSTKGTQVKENTVKVWLFRGIREVQQHFAAHGYRFDG